MIVSHRNTTRRIGKWAALTFFIVFSTVSSGLTADTGPRDPRQYFFIQSFGDLPEELQVAEAEGKKGILLFFEAEHCKYCQAMLRDVLSDREVQDFYREHFISIAIDIHGDIEITDFDGITLPSKVFASHRQVFMTPVLSFLDIDGREIYRHLGMVKTPEALLSIGDYIIGKHYLDTEYKVFAKRNELEQKTVTEHVSQE